MFTGSLIIGYNPSNLGLVGGNKHMVGLIMPSDYFQGTTDKTQAAEISSVRNRKQRKCKGIEIHYNVFYHKKNILKRHKKNSVLNKYYVKSISKNKLFPRPIPLPSPKY